MFSRRDSSLLEWIIAILVALLAGVLLLKVVMLFREPFEEELNRQSQVVSSMKEGIVIDKYGFDGYTYFMTTYVNDVPITTPTYIPGYHWLKISDEVNGEKVERKIYVSSYEYHSYEVGDTYKVK